MADNKRRCKQGTVISSKMRKSVVVRVNRTERHPLYEKVLARSRKYYAHDEREECREGDIVTIEESRPLSKLKRWRVVERVQAAG